MRHGYEKIDLYERPEYLALVDFSGELGERAIELAGHDYLDVLESDCQARITRLLDDYWNMNADENPKSWSPLRPKEVGPEGVKVLCEALQNHELEATEEFIRDSITWAWEKALMPNDSDMRYAIQAAKEAMESAELGSIWDPLLEGGDPLPAGEDTVESIMESLMAKVEWLHDMDGKVRLTLNFGEALASWRLKFNNKGKNKQQFEQALDREFEHLRDEFIKQFFKALNQEMEDSTPGNRVSWRAQWNEMLKDEPRVKTVQAELLEYLKGRRYS